MGSSAAERAVADLVRAGVVKPQELLGCTSAEIAELERRAGGRLPSEYVSFLNAMGRAAGGFMRGTDITCPGISALSEALDVLLEETGSEWKRAPEQFVFAGHQGYEFLLFTRGQGDDPPVFRFGEGDDGPEPVSDRFSHWLHGAVQDAIAEHSDSA